MRLRLWHFALIALIVSAYTLPYTVFSERGQWSGSFAFWCAFGLAVFVLIVAVMRRWNTR